MTADDAGAVVALVVAAEVSSADEADVVRELLAEYATAKDAGHTAIVVELDGRVVGVAYYRPKGPADRLWDVTMIAVEPGLHGRGHGRALRGHVEDDLRSRGQRLLTVDTSSTAPYARARNFYRRCGYVKEARIRDYSQDGDGLVVFTKRLADPHTPGP